MCHEPRRRKSIDENKEYRAFIYKVNFKLPSGVRITYYTYSETISGTAKNVSFPKIDALFKSIPATVTVLYDIHTHGSADDNHINEEFSSDEGYENGYPKGDLAVQRHYKIGGFLVTPGGLLLVNYIDEGNSKIICDCLERDKDVHKEPQGKTVYTRRFRDPDNLYQNVSDDLSPTYFSKAYINEMQKPKKKKKM